MQSNHTLHRVIFLGRKESAAYALQYLLSKRIEITLVVTDDADPKNKILIQIARKNKITVITDPSKIYFLIEKKHPKTINIDLIISYLFWKKIKIPLLSLGKRGCINFHPASVIEYKGRAGYNTAILDKKESYGVTAHFIDSEEFDMGPIIRINRFPIDTLHETALSLERKTQKELLILFKQVIDQFNKETIMKTFPNKGGLYLTKQQLDDLKIVDMKKESTEDINRKIRAFFFPPFQGAVIKIHNTEYTLINKEILDYLSKKFINEKI